MKKIKHNNYHNSHNNIITLIIKLEHLQTERK
jgi:hypothetical protein